jgi:hypothetical protein
MEMNPSRRVRKRLLSEPGATAGPLASASLSANEIDLATCATVLFSSEDPNNPIEHLLDGQSGRGGTHWTSARPNVSEELVIEFDHPQRISRMIFEAEEMYAERIQQVTVEFSIDGGKIFRRCLVQEYTFSPGGATYQREDFALDLSEVTHVRLLIVPNKSGAGSATLTSLRLFR